MHGVCVYKGELSVYVCVCARVCLCAYMYVLVYTCVCVCVSLPVCDSFCTCVCVVKMCFIQINQCIHMSMCSFVVFHCSLFELQTACGPLSDHSAVKPLIMCR